MLTIPIFLSLPAEFMINPYCASLEGIFSELVYYGLLKEDDAQCFKADVNVEPTFYILLVGALILALVNVFVMKAVSHYFRDIDGKPNLRAEASLADLDALKAHEDGGSGEAIDESAIHPTPVLFTDVFRWLLYREDVMLSRQSSNESASNVHMEPAIKGSMSNESNGDLEANDECETGRMDSSSDEEFRAYQASGSVGEEDEDEKMRSFVSPPDNGFAHRRGGDEDVLPSDDDSNDINTVSGLTISGFDPPQDKIYQNVSL